MDEKFSCFRCGEATTLAGDDAITHRENILNNLEIFGDNDPRLYVCNDCLTPEWGVELGGFDI
uniref:Uncharacterized protein n=1 Tax=viral metagenome TaxID=1070528 RepID=A0A6M3L557_9ZZZZ